jgi:hypothetical protein
VARLLFSSGHRNSVLRRFFERCKPCHRSSQILARAVIETLEHRVFLSAVTNTADSGTGSLRAAILAADSAGGNQTITFASTLTGSTINLTSGALGLNDTSGTLTIQGPTTGSLTIDAGSSSRVFNNAINSTVSLNNLVITGGSGSQGGGIHNYGNLTLSASTVSGNSSTDIGGGIYCGAGSDLTITESTISDNNALSQYGGGIFAGTGTNLTITNSTISGNSAAWSGAINTYGNTAIIDSTISGNTATVSAGAIYTNSLLQITDSTFNDNSAVNSGGAIDNQGDTTISDSTFSGNSSSNATHTYGVGGAIANGATLTIGNSTFYDNTAVDGGAIFNDISTATFTITDSTLSGNSATSIGAGIYGGGAINGTIVANSIHGRDLVGSFTGSGNLIGNSNGALSSSTNILGTATSPINPKLLPLSDFGGPTQTMALLPGSPAIGTGGTFDWPDSSPIATDQRGDPRPTSGAVDIGAYEVLPLPDLPTSSTPAAGFSYSAPSSLGGALPSGVNAFTPPAVSGGAVSGAPAIAASNLTAGPNNTITVTGTNLSTFAGDTDGTAYSDTQFLVYGESGGVGTLVPAEIQDTTNTASSTAGGALITIPTSEPTNSMYLVWAENADGATTPIAINQTQAQWFSVVPSTSQIFSSPASGTPGTATYTTNASTGQTVYVYGNNLSNGTTSWVYLQKTDGSSGEYATVTSVNPYQVEFTLPSDLPSGNYNVWVNNGLGGNYSWSKAPGIISTTATAVAFPTVGQAGWFDVTASPYNADDTGATDAGTGIMSAISAAESYQSAHSNAPVTLYFPNGTYKVSGGEQILLPSNIQILGQSHTGVIVNFTQDPLGSGEGPNGYGVFDIGFPDFQDATNVEYNSLTIQYDGTDDGTLIRERSGTNLVFSNVTLTAKNLEPMDVSNGSLVTVMNSSISGGGGGLGGMIYIGGATNTSIMDTEFYMEYGVSAAVYADGTTNFAFFNSTAQDFDDSLDMSGNPNNANGWGQGRLLENNYNSSILNEYVGGDITNNLGSPVLINGGEQINNEGNTLNGAEGLASSASADGVVLSLSDETHFSGTTTSATSTSVTGTFAEAPGNGEYLIFDGQADEITAVSVSGSSYTLTLHDSLSVVPTGADALEIADPPGTGQNVIVTSGNGMGEFATIVTATQGSASVTLALDRDWQVQPDTSSTIITVNTISSAVFYGNILQDQVGPYGSTDVNGFHTTIGLGSSAGVEVFNGGYNLSIVDNTIENTNIGILIESSGGIGNPDYFITVANNEIDDTHKIGISVAPSVPFGQPNGVGVILRDNTIAWNNTTEWASAVYLNGLTNAGLGDGDTDPQFANPDDTQNPMGIEIGGDVPDSAHIENSAWTPSSTTVTLSVVEQNLVTTTVADSSPLGLGVYVDPDVFVYQNTFNAGPTPDTSVPAVAFAAIYYTGVTSSDPTALLSGNIYENYSNNYVDAQFNGEQVGNTFTTGSLPTPLLQVPYYVFTVAAPAGQNILLNLPIFDDGASALGWSATSSSFALTFQSSTGSANAESLGGAGLLINTSVATPGTYTVTISDGGQEKKISIYLTVF